MSDSDTKEAEDSGLGVILAIAAGIIAAAVGVVATYFVMTGVLEYKLEPKESIQDNTEGGGKGKGRMGPAGKGGMGPGGKGGMGPGGKDGMAPGGKGDQGGAPPGGAMNDGNGQRWMDQLIALAGASHHGSSTVSVVVHLGL